MSSKYALKLITKCGDCTACCTHLTIGEPLNKPAGIDCPNLINNQCSIYKDRPQCCKDFECVWFRGGVLDRSEAYRPDNLGLLFVESNKPMFKDVIGVVRVHKTISPKARRLLWSLEKKHLFILDDVLYGPQELIDKWKEMYSHG